MGTITHSANIWQTSRWAIGLCAIAGLLATAGPQAAWQAPSLSIFLATATGLATLLLSLATLRLLIGKQLPSPYLWLCIGLGILGLFQLCQSFQSNEQAISNLRTMGLLLAAFASSAVWLPARWVEKTNPIKVYSAAGIISVTFAYYSSQATELPNVPALIIAAVTMMAVWYYMTQRFIQSPRDNLSFYANFYLTIACGIGMIAMASPGQLMWWFGLITILAATLSLSKHFTTGFIDDLSRAEALNYELEEVAANYETIKTTATSALIAADDEGIIQSFNAAATKMFGYSEDEVIGQPITILMPDDLREKHSMGLQNYLKTGDAKLIGRIVELTGLRKNGETFTIDLSLADGKSRDRTIFIAVIQDASKRKQQESELRDAVKQAEETGQYKSQFVANMSQEIRTPLNTIVGATDLLLKEAPLPEQRQMLNTIVESTETLIVTVDNILDLTRIEAGDMQAQYDRVNIADLLFGVVNNLIPMADANDVRLTYNLENDLPEWIEIDSARFRQVLLNLISNAIKFSQRPSEVGNNYSRVDIRLVRNGEDRLHIFVQDEGIGMSPEVLENVFQPFSQGDTSNTRKFGGTGLGLSLTRNYIELLGGKITLNSQENFGTLATIDLPLVPLSGPTQIPDLTGVRIFGIMDTPIAGFRIKSMIEDAGGFAQFTEDVDVINSNLEAESDAAIVLIGIGANAVNTATYDAIRAQHPKLKFIILSIDRMDLFGVHSDHLFTANRFPLHPTQMMNGISFLAGRGGSALYLYGDESAPGQEGDSEKSDAEGDKKYNRDTAPLENTAPQTCQILVVEDNETNRDVIATQVEMLGHSVVTADNGKEGLDIWRSQTCDLILLDCGLPIMDGYEMTLAVRADEANSQDTAIPIIAISANMDKENYQRCLDVGMNDYISKPAPLTELRRIFEKWL